MRKLISSLALTCSLAAAVSPASASILYRMVGGVCTDTVPKGEIYDPETETYTQFKLCADDITVLVWMSDAYVPGTVFFQSNAELGEGAAPIMERFHFDDGASQLDFSPESFNYLGIGVGGLFPEHAGPGEIDMRILDGASFAGGSTWEFATNFPNYRSEGFSAGWVRVPEPGSLPTVLVGLAVAAALRRRLRRLPRRADGTD